MVTVAKNKDKSQVAARPAAATDTRTVTTAQRPWVRCEFAGHQVFYEPGTGNAAAALTAHYNTQHQAELLERASA